MSVIDEITREVETDPASVGLILHGSRAAGTDREGSDFDLMRVVTDEAYPSCAALREKRTGADGLAADIFYSSPERLSDLAERPDWRVGMLVTGRVLVDRGPLAALVETTLSRAGEHAHAQLDEHYDAYLNCLVRSLKAWRRGDELGGRMQASESALHLVRHALRARAPVASVPRPARRPAARAGSRSRLERGRARRAAAPARP